MLLTALLTLIAAPACQAPEASPTSPAPAQAGAEQEFSWEPDLSGAVALSGSTLAIGAPLAGQGGTVTIYRSGPGGWEELARLAPEGDAEGEGFGAAVALSGDTLAVGAPLADEGAGTFYVYERSEDGWHQVLRFVRDVWYDGLVVEGLPHTGAAVALHGDRLVVGSPGTGQVEAFVRSAEGAWLSMAYLSAEPLDAEQGELFLPNPRDAFGASVAIWNDTIAVGAPTAQVNGVTAGMVSLFTRERVDPAAPDVDRGWKRDWFMTSDDAEEGDRFGASVSLCGRRLAVGAPREDQRALDAGAAYVFARAGGEWKQEAKLMASDGVRDAGFGNVELLGTLLAVGAPGQRPLEQDETAVTERSGEVYLFGYAPEPGVGTGPRRWTERAHFGGDEGDTSFGDALAVSGLDVAVRSAQTPAHLTDAAEHYLSGAARSSVADVVREVVTDGSWATVEQHPAFAPEIGVLTPVVQGLVDGSDLPSIVMPPPCTVRFTVRPEDGPIVLRAAAGLDHTFLPRRLPGLELIRIGYEVLVDDELVFEAEIEPLFKGEYDHRRWRRLIDPEERPEGLALGGLPLVPGSVVTLRTKVTHPEVAVEELPRIPAGFGEVELVRRSAREPQPATRERPNIVLIVMDTLRADALSCYRDDATASVAGAPPTPFLAALARRGVLFENAYAASSWTWPSTASLLTGLWPEEHGVVSDESCYLTGELDTLPEVLAANGYATGAFSCNPLIVPDKNFDQGFEYFDRPLSRGFRNSHEIRADVEAWIGAHAVVADLDAGILWVAEPSHGLGRAVAFDVHGVRADVAPLPPSSDLALFERVGERWKPDLEEARRLVARRDPAAAAHLERMTQDNPLHPEPWVLRAKLTDDPREARTFLERARSLRPAYAAERADVEERLAALGAEEAP